jgi:hypothetical protein
MKPVGKKTMHASPLRIYGEMKWSCIKWLPKEENETRFTEKLMVIFKIFYPLFIFCVAHLEI